MLYFYRCSKYGFRLTGCNENAVSHTFFHQSAGITEVYIQKSLSAAAALAAGFSYYAYPDRGSSENQFVNLIGEPGANPGWRPTRVYQFEAGTTKTYLQGNTNTGSASVNNSGSTTNVVITEGTVNGGTTVSANSLAATSAITSAGGASLFGGTAMTTPSDFLGAYGTRFLRIGRYNFVAGDKKDICTFSIGNTSRAARIQLTALHGWTSSGSSSWGTDTIDFELYRGNASTVAIRNYSCIKGTTTGFCEIAVSGTTATVSYFSQHDTVVRFYCVHTSSALNADVESVLTVTALDGTTTSTQTTIPAGINYLRPLNPYPDNTLSLGNASYRWSEVFAGTGTINTSDANLKQQIVGLSDQEKATAVVIKGLVKKFKYNDAVSRKGDDARIHVGVIAQEVEQAFIGNGLDPENYGLFCKDTWWELDGSPIDVEEGEQPPAAAVQQSRFGIRYDQLLAFVISAL
jgi:hypothetical protein